MSVNKKGESKLRLVDRGHGLDTSEKIAASIVQNSTRLDGRKVTSGRVLKAEDLRQADSRFVISPYVSSSLLASGSSSHESIESLRQNLNSLSQLHSRLRFMLKELDELIHD